ncbi:Uncharacterised protein [uncultured archaeon]|nr:Uncharacterised protein [uncultured archaeon]
MNAAYFNCPSGIAGDMVVAALIDAGASFPEIKNEVGKIPLSDYRLRTEKVNRSGVEALRFIVDVEEGHQPPRAYRDIRKMIDESALSPAVKEKSQAIFAVLAETESHVHGVPTEKIHFHEVGAVDSIIDIVATCAALNQLKIDAIYSSPLPWPKGSIKTAHGIMENPAPATRLLLEGIPTYPVDVEFELVTPTGAAILKALSTGFGSPPKFKGETKSGFGAGTKDLKEPNVLFVTIGATKTGR